MPESLNLPSDPNEAADLLRETSKSKDVVVFKKSPICPVSTRAEFEFRTWLKSLSAADPIAVAEIDVIAEKPLARGLTAALGIDHQSPQALWFRGGELQWHDSHSALTKSRFDGAHAS